MKAALIACVVALFAVVAAQAVAASGTTRVSGNFTVTEFGQLECSPVGNSNFLFECFGTGLISEYTGSLVGSSTFDYREIFNCATGQTHGSGIETFTGSVEGIGEGTLTWGTQFRTHFDCATEDLTDFVGRGAVHAGTGDLEGVSGKLKFGAVTYQGQLRL